MNEKPKAREVARTIRISERDTITVIDHLPPAPACSRLLPPAPDVPPASDLIRQQFEQMKAANAKMRNGGE